MSLPITNYTSYDSVRAALGVSSDDLEDATLALDIYADALELEFDEVATNFWTQYVQAHDAATPTADQVKLLTVTRLFATYAIAKHLTGSLPLFAAKQVTDSKAGVQRFDNPFREVVKSIHDQYGTLRTRLANAVGTLISSSRTSVTPVYFAVASPSDDPITGA